MCEAGRLAGIEKSWGPLTPPYGFQSHCCHACLLTLEAVLNRVTVQPSEELPHTALGGRGCWLILLNVSWYGSIRHNQVFHKHLLMSFSVCVEDTIEG